MNLLNKVWDEKLDYFINSSEFKDIMKKVEKDFKIKEIYPKQENVFKAFELTDYDDVKVVILGQDPYHGEGEAHGLAFSVLEGVKTPPSLRNIFKELESDLGIKKTTTNLSSWGREGVLLLNAILTVEKGTPLAHQKYGWEIFTDEVIKCLNKRDNPVIFILWGGYARSKKKLIDQEKHYIIESVHPSPLSSYRGFFGSRPFSKVNIFLKENNCDIIKW